MDAEKSETLWMEGGTPPLPFADELTPPTRLGPYEDVRPFAYGGMGMICRARQRLPEREVAIKLLRSGAHASGAQKERFLQEIRLAAGLDHPGIVPIFDAGEQDGWLYFVMPLLEGAESLVDWAASQRLEWRARVALAVRVAEIVAVLHRRGMLHHDLKPGNILVDRHGEVRVLDFGLALALEPHAGDPRLSLGGIAGTPAYLSPERAAGVPSRELTAAADVYALAVVTYELLTGHMPYEVECPLPEALRSIREARPAAPSSFVLDLPPAVEQVILAALSKSPTHRPADAGVYAATLRRALDGSAAGPLFWSSWLPRGWPVRLALAVGLVLLVAAGGAAIRHRGLGAHAASDGACSAPQLQAAAQAGAALAVPGDALASLAEYPVAKDVTIMTDGAVTSGSEKAPLELDAASSGTGARVVFVDRNAKGANNGTSWADAYTDLRSVLAGAFKREEIWVAAGTYTPSAEHDRSASFQMRSGVALYGGFTGTETRRMERNWTTNVTILSGDIGVPGDNTDNSYHVLSYAYGAEPFTLDGFTVAGGNANGGNWDNNGGGVFCREASARLANCCLSANLAADAGGGAFADGGTLILEDCRLVGNTAGGWGGGAVRVAKASFKISRCFFGGNTATAADPMGYGGAVMAQSCTFGAVADCLFVGNRAHQGGAIRTGNGASPSITRCTFSGNRALGSGGAITNGSDCSPTILDCTFAGNQSPYGGALANWTSGAITRSCVMVGNVASLGGGALIAFDNRPAALNCTLVANSASQGGGIYACRNAVMALANCIVWGNMASSARAQAYYDDANGVAGGSFVSCLVQGGWSGAEVPRQGVAAVTDGGGNLDTDPAFVGVAAKGTWTAVGSYSVDTGMTVLTCRGAGWPQDAFADCFLNPDTSQCLQYCVAGNTGDTVTILGDCTGFAVVGDTFQVNDYRLRSASPCIDAATGDETTPPNDLAGKARYDDPDTPNTGTGTPTFVDIGAYEFQGTPPAAR